MDRLDKKILSILQSDGSITNLELAERVGLSPTPCARRVKQLEEAGYISSCVMLLDRKKLGLGLTAYLHVVLERHTRDHFERFETALREFDEVVECAMITGQDADYLLKVVVPDLDYYQRFLLNNLTELDGVKGVQSSFVLQTPITTTQLPLKHLGDEL